MSTWSWPLLGLSLFVAAWAYLSVPRGAPWAPTSLDVTHKMLKMAGVKSGETGIDMGAGDDRVVMVAARSFGARAIGVEIDPLRCLLANLAIALLGLRGKAHVFHENMFGFDTSGADVVVLSLLQGTNQRVNDKLLKELRPGTRGVSHTFSMTGWTPVGLDDHHGIFLYEVGRTGGDVRTRFV
jgi:hypothetical protein